MAELTDKGGARFGSGGFQRKSPAEAGLGLRHIWKGPETICDLRAGVPNHSELEPSGGVPHGLGGATEGGGVSLFPLPVGVNTQVPLTGIATLMARRLVAG